jgi:ubiquinone/menaquinone biosynthesis C-methylase UbiE
LKKISSLKLSGGLFKEKNKMTTSPLHIVPGDFEKLYLQLRQKEGRIYTDEEVSMLPEIAEAHPHYKEWQMRKESSQKLIGYLKKRNRATDILEPGCGNGWLSAKLSGIKGSVVTGIDINTYELNQARRVFSNIPNLQFRYGGLNELKEEEMKFDVIVLAAATQYFPSLKKIIDPAIKLLNQNGEIHIIDSHFYTISELGPAKQRSLLYFEAAGFPEMAYWYFHHNLDDLENYNYTVLYDPNSLFNRFLRNKNPFYWIRIKS